MTTGSFRSTTPGLVSNMHFPPQSAGDYRLQFILLQSARYNAGR